VDKTVKEVTDELFGPEPEPPRDAKADADAIWESAMRWTLKEDRRYQDPKALEARMNVLRSKRQTEAEIPVSLPKISLRLTDAPAHASPQWILLRDAELEKIEREAEACVKQGCCVKRGPTIGQMDYASSCAIALLPIVAALADAEARAGNGAGWMVWARVWCGLLLLRDMNDAIKVEPFDPEADELEALDLMQAVLGIDGDGQDITYPIPSSAQKMAARLYG
jgi:hypothetical protein